MQKISKPLQEMTLQELEELRLAWLQDVQPVVLSAFSTYHQVKGHWPTVPWKRTSESIYGRTFDNFDYQDVRMTITLVDGVFDTHAGAFQNTYNITIMILPFQQGCSNVAEMNIEVSENGNILLSEKWLKKPYYFARPDIDVDWVGQLQAMVETYDRQVKVIQEKEDFDRKKALVEMLTSGKLQVK